MIKKIEEWAIPLDGLMKYCFRLSLRISQEEEKSKDFLNIRLRITRLVNNDETKILIPRVISSVKFLGNTLSTMKDLYFLGENNDILLINDRYELENESHIAFDVILRFEDSNNYILPVNSKGYNFMIDKEKASREPSISLDYINNDNTIDVFAYPSVDNYDLLEFKVNDNNWLSNTKNSGRITVAKLNKNQFIQSRIKIDNEYFYSKVLKIENSIQ